MPWVINIPRPVSIRSAFFSNMAASGSLKNITRSGIRNMITRITVAGSGFPVIYSTITDARAK